MEVSLPPFVTVSGNMPDNQGAPVAGATVSATNIWTINWDNRVIFGFLDKFVSDSRRLRRRFIMK